MEKMKPRNGKGKGVGEQVPLASNIIVHEKLALSAKIFVAKCNICCSMP